MTTPCKRRLTAGQGSGEPLSNPATCNLQPHTHCINPATRTARAVAGFLLPEKKISLACAREKSVYAVAHALRSLRYGRDTIPSLRSLRACAPLALHSVPRSICEALRPRAPATLAAHSVRAAPHCVQPCRSLHPNGCVPLAQTRCAPKAKATAVRTRSTLCTTAAAVLRTRDKQRTCKGVEDLFCVLHHLYSKLPPKNF